MAHKVIISGGGTGGHIFPAIAIANALRRAQPEIEILFVGAAGKMEMEKVPAAGYRIIGLDIQGINRQSLLKNLALPFKMVKSLWKSRQIIKEFGAEVAVGVGGYASGPLLMMANHIGIPTLIQEQNSFAGKTNKSLGKKAQKICVAYEGMDQFFPESKIMLTGNPIRRASVNISGKYSEAITSFGLQEGKKTILVTGGSLGANTLNECMKGALDKLLQADIQVIWQCGSYYFEKLERELNDKLPVNIKLVPFLQRMDYAYAAADVIIARAGAGTISELCVIGKPAILVPSPNVAEDHQTKNAVSLVDKKAALMVTDMSARIHLIDEALKLIHDEAICVELGENIKKLALLDADEVIANEVLKLIN
ncbi:undecaprenyldiphospho-muramoylpentapeptide beta-N-acetylglucosaminyltransferase [Sphingobacterium alkalisoli]|uniref:UDP-N-acetylglucosamine--N-acetylmuramyl-(pentapeptide) pyrophosphoryl-undecaprenol N-acetylglucosamine transferase n=1 Tax=Sphingobacterium alkalisoli TaxID=1874115 RepID=A0A4U0GPD0_9SPHI|nr:undecaprenyldiphospho-muramoylpentapeptide beta-N-acetylglucosaminyltransferase [Sphingobacterium alkalisoli]TJY60760.1 undecaprenyldiphospho-muramoylpentapeptide beta-N-acetylglucosaminyltransferase [Sphingobacterium alkalisoli]GGH31775.1 UDP-N-acetylglucosamine--N-acetylmuramyl-(pentapeptide) pyrophosphoryl-undecaprenol N-acetylglucosamine transferase [Sphingobacterium alkalisoli]